MKVLVTGGAGFIGSNLVEALINDDRVTHVKVLDNLSTGFRSNLSGFESNNKFSFIEGDITDYKTCEEASKNIDLISHQAALGSVPRSLKDPLTSNSVNVNGTLNVFHAAVANGVKRVVFAASSSTYGDSKSLPKVEHIIGKPLSPYAVTKYVNELYAEVFSTSYKFEFIGLRYFNVFGPKQDPNGVYAAVIPLFFKAALNNEKPTINGDGSFSRDFTYINNVIQANTLSLFTENPKAINQIYNVAYGDRLSVKDLWFAIKNLTNSNVEVNYGPKREGDVPHSHANIDKAKTLLNYSPKYDVKAGLALSSDWFNRMFS